MHVYTRIPQRKKERKKIFLFVLFLISTWLIYTNDYFWETKFMSSRVFSRMRRIISFRASFQSLLRSMRSLNSSRRNTLRVVSSSAVTVAVRGSRVMSAISQKNPHAFNIPFCTPLRSICTLHDSMKYAVPSDDAPSCSMTDPRLNDRVSVMRRKYSISSHEHPSKI